MQKIESYRDLNVWKLAMELVVICYQLAAKLPAHERFGWRDAQSVDDKSQQWTP